MEGEGDWWLGVCNYRRRGSSAGKDSKSLNCYWKFRLLLRWGEVPGLEGSRKEPKHFAREGESFWSPNFYKPGL